MPNPVASNLQIVTTRDQATVTWTTDVPCDSAVTYGKFITTCTIDGVQRDGSLVTSHSMIITGLTSNQLYCFAADSSDSHGNPANTLNGQKATLPPPGYSSLCFNAVLQVIQAAAAAGTIGVDPNSIFQAAQPMAGIALPYIAISLPSEPYENDSWGGTSNLKNGIFQVDVHVVGELRKEDTTPTGHPYGDINYYGILILSDLVQDALDQAYATLKAASPKVVDVFVATTIHGRNSADARQIVSSTRVKFLIRFFAGQRS